jgi:hypothetical protein
MLNRVREHFGYVDETALIVLKGHLLVEESLDSIISKFVFHPEFLEMANLGFAQKVSIARALNLTEHENEIWEIATKLNSLRNEIAHGLNSPKRAKKTKAVIDLYLRLSADMPDSGKLKEQPEHVLVSFAVVVSLVFSCPSRKRPTAFGNGSTSSTKGSTRIVTKHNGDLK